jgi:sulfite oxidase
MTRYHNPVPSIEGSETQPSLQPSINVQRKRLLTPTPLFYVRNHGNIPCINPNKYKLTISGLTKKPLTLSLDDLKEDFPKVTQVSTLLCTNNDCDGATLSSDRMWSKAAISTAKWGGIRLRHLLLAVGVDSLAQNVSFAGMDEVPNIGGVTNYKSNIPIRKAMSPEVLLAYEMNDEPLPPMHGYPLRAIVPGFASLTSVKWVTQIDVCQRQEAFFPEGNEKQTLNLVINRPQNKQTIFDDILVLEGYALPNAGHLIETVEVSGDGGKSWVKAQIFHKDNPWEWCFWEAQLKVPVGARQVIARVCDSSAKRQLKNPLGDKNPNGNAGVYWETITVRIVDED